MLQAGLRCNALRIAAEAGVHRRTVFRDFAALRSLGFPISFDATTGCYFLPRGSKLPSEKGMAELLSLFRDDVPGSNVGTASTKSSPSDTIIGAEETDSQTWQDLLASEKLFPDVLVSLIAAIQSRQRIVVVRSNGTGPEREVALRIEEVTFKDRGWQIRGTNDSGEQIHLDVESIAECIEAEMADDAARQQE